MQPLAPASPLVLGWQPCPRCGGQFCQYPEGERSRCYATRVTGNAHLCKYGYRITGKGFVAGVVYQGCMMVDCAPILKKQVWGFNTGRLRDYCTGRGWKYERFNEREGGS